jgi:threonylcarbamoyladenosine tRNA methylthiotransferase MtaB
LGCKVNQADSEALAAELIRRGYRIAAAHEHAAACIVNTCAVTHVAEAKARKLIRQLARDHPDAALIVTGCYAERAAEELAGIPGVAWVLPNDRKGQAGEIIEGIVQNGDGCLFPNGCLASPRQLRETGNSPRAPALQAIGPRPARPGSVRAFVKVQDGCDHRCSYCIVPDVRGPMRSRSLAEVAAEMDALAQAGAREIVICGIRLGAYGEEPAGRGLAQLLHAAREAPVPRLRLSSIEPWDLGEELQQEVTEHPLLCPHLHLPLQSGDDDILRAMGRPYSYDDYRRLILNLRRIAPDIAITTDLMVGFPGESEEAFANTCRAVEDIGFARAHAFRYSRRPGTRAASMPGQVAEREKSRRSAHLATLAQQSAQRFAERFVGRVAPVLFEEWCDGTCVGLTDTYLSVAALGDASFVGHIAGVEVVGVESNRIAGRLARQDVERDPAANPDRCARPV